jgi:DNA polymerase I-like protein with 3'-5' exonuclease and polymerase domains
LSLRYLGSIYTDFEPWKEDDEQDSKGLVFTDDWEKLKRYNALDCIVTARCWGQMQDERDPRVDRLYELHKKLSVIAAKMHTTGFHVDKNNHKFLAFGLLQQFKEQEKQLQALVNIPGFRCTPDHMRALIYKRHEREFRPAGVGKKGNVLKSKPERKAIKRFSLPDPIDPNMWATEGEKVSVDYSALLMLVTNPACPEDLKAIIDVYWDAASTWKARSTFVTSAKVRHAIGKDGKLRPGWNSCGTDTGRWSCSEPNIMNLEQYLRAMYRAEP